MLSLTKHEKYILIFLLSIGLLGIGVLHCKKLPAHISSEVNTYYQPEVLNINTATTDELTSLKGIGPLLASRIVEYRRSNGAFRETEDLKKVKGIGPHKFKDVKDSIEVK